MAPWVDEDLVDVFYEESMENLQTLEDLLSELSNGLDQKDIEQIFRMYHSLKGVAGVMGFQNLSDSVHYIENKLKETSEEGNFNQNESFVNWLIETRDVILDMVQILYDAAINDLNKPDLTSFKEKIVNQEDSSKIEISNDDLSYFFQNFIEIKDELVFIENSNELSEKEISIIKNKLHSLKGEAAILDLENFCSIIHELESSVDDELLQKSIFFFSKINDEVDILNAEVNKFWDGYTRSTKSITKKSDFEIVKTFFNSLSFLLKDLKVDGFQDIVLDVLELDRPSLVTIVSEINDDGWDNIKSSAKLKVLLFEIKEALSFYQQQPSQTIEVDQDPQDPEEQKIEILKEQLRPPEKIISENESKKNEIPVEEIKVTENQQKNTSQNKGVKKVKPKEMLKVDSELVKKLLNMSGEFIVAKNTLLHEIKTLKEDKVVCSKLEKVSATFNRLCDSLQHDVMKLRMVTCKEVFKKAPKIVRDISKKLDKNIKIEIIGEDNEIDKLVAEKVSDALLHIVRNSCDHGIENKEKRQESGKSIEGRVTLGASYEGSYLLITIADDGGGINTERVAQKAFEAGVIDQAAIEEMSENEIAELIFHPGLSTAQEVSEISGRGVGMDVVKTNIEELGGHVELETSKGQGSLFKLYIPQNTTIRKSLICKVNNVKVAFGVDQITETIKVPRSKVQKHLRKTFFTLRGEVVHVVTNIDFPTYSNMEKQCFLLVKNKSKIYAFPVQENYGCEDLVIKKTPTLLGNKRGLIGVSVLGDGAAILIYDLIQMLDGHYHEELSQQLSA